MLDYMERHKSRPLDWNQFALWKQRRQWIFLLVASNRTRKGIRYICSVWFWEKAELTWMVLCARNLCVLRLKLTSIRSQLTFIKPLIISSAIVVNNDENSDKSVWGAGIIKSFIIFTIAENTGAIKGTELL